MAVRRWNCRVIHHGFPYPRKAIDILGKAGPSRAGALKRMALLAPEKKAYIHGIVCNLNVDLEKRGKSVTLPIDLVREAVLEEG